MRIKVEGLESVLDARRTLGLLADLAPPVLADALNHTAYQARQALHSEMSSVFDKPTPWTLKSIKVFLAKPKNLEAALWVDDYRASKDVAPDRWLKAEVFGGPREAKGFEKQLRRQKILPAGMFAVPAAGARIDQYGNMSRGQIVQILSGLGAWNGYGSSANATDSKKSVKKGHATAFFVMKRGKTPIGIAERRDNEMVMVVAFVKQPQYRPRLDFHGIVARVADENLATNVDLAVVKSLQG